MEWASATVPQAGSVVSGTLQSCTACGGETVDRQVRITLWSGDRLVVVDKVPARICEACQEQYYDESTSGKILQLVNAGFPDRAVQRQIQVPVFDLEDTSDPFPGDAGRDGGIE